MVLLDPKCEMTESSDITVLIRKIHVLLWKLNGLRKIFNKGSLHPLHPYKSGQRSPLWFYSPEQGVIYRRSLNLKYKTENCVIIVMTDGEDFDLHTEPRQEPQSKENNLVVYNCLRNITRFTITMTPITPLTLTQGRELPDKGMRCGTQNDHRETVDLVRCTR